MTPVGGVCPKSGKFCHRGKKMARSKAKASENACGYQIWVYKCMFCHHWHLTHKNPKERRTP